MCKGTVVQFLANPDLFCLCSFQTNHGICPASYSMTTGRFFSWVYSGMSMKLITHAHLVASLSCYTAIPPNGYMVRTQTTFTQWNGHIRAKCYARVKHSCAMVPPSLFPLSIYPPPSALPSVNHPHLV